jgi:hypothetical protein
MREIRTSGSEGGGTGYPTGPPYPYQDCQVRLRRSDLPPLDEELQVPQQLRCSLFDSRSRLGYPTA